MILLAGPTDLVADCERRAQVSPSLQALFNHPRELDDVIRTKLREASPLTHVSKQSPPCLLIHGTVDESVPYSQSEIFKARLQDLGVPCDLITIPAAGHRLREWNDLRPAYEREMIDWLRKQRF
jgi:dipeptidyl aminopeptidase/acylaminoacyl peptidase